MRLYNSTGVGAEKFETNSPVLILPFVVLGRREDVLSVPFCDGCVMRGMVVFLVHVVGTKRSPAGSLLG